MMKMEERTAMLTFQNNCEDINSIGVEAEAKEIKEKNVNSDITAEEYINKHEDKPNLNLGNIENMDILSQEDAVDQFLAGDSKNEFNDELVLSDFENDNDIIDLKSSNTNIISQLEAIEIPEQPIEHEVLKIKRPTSIYRRSYNPVVKSLKKRSIRCLNRMHVMEDVREASDALPSSPGHAEQRPDTNELPTVETVTKNGYHDSSKNDDIAENTENEEIKEDNKLKDDSENNLLQCESLIEKEVEDESERNNSNDDNLSNDSTIENETTKRKVDSDDSPIKKLKTEIQENYYLRDKIFNDYFEFTDCNNLEQIQTYSDQILVEIRTLNELAKEKEREWNNIIHLKKLKEELLLRIQRRKQVLILNDSKNEFCEIDKNDRNDSLDERLKISTTNSQSILKSNLLNLQRNYMKNNSTLQRLQNEKNKQKKPQSYNHELNGQSNDYKQGRQRPVLDVQSIIADYRQRHPETVPRRGRRIRSMLNAQNAHLSDSNKVNSSGVLNFSSVALGSGAQVRQNLPVGALDMNAELNLLLSAMDSGKQDVSRPSSADSSVASQDNMPFRDMLVQFAKLSQSERHELLQNFVKPPPPYPEVTVHPVPTTSTNQPPTNSLLHGILTKSQTKPNNKTSFSPTLARLLTAPERSSVSPQINQNVSTGGFSAGNVSITDILSTNKARNEITITPVCGQFDTPVKGKTNSEEEETEENADRLVIDEGGEGADGRNRGDNNSDAGDEVPQCQGCNQKPAQFVCAGCGNQWYCSRDCQVSAWDEHSEVCSG